ncbi:Nucleoside diphosphate kinase [Dirofilaria immitis]
MKLHKNERTVFDNVSPTHSGQEQITAGNLGIIKRLKYENEEHNEMDISNKGNLDDIKCRSIELLYPDQMKLTNIKEEFVSDVKPDLCSKPLALIADYGGDSSSDSVD